ncbi:Phage tail assembly [Streptococcus macedonicus]|uniref:phage tail protein n=1 Tax=Streptococcus macedonicus TaxID=59310 RepID=UPI0008127736|nr:phage tail protein [Streptococcus macedonicus]SCA90014.1 Phage tail assembly [Streptococcus macedonicus]
MSKNNVRIAIRGSTDSHNVAFFDNKSGIKYKSANLQRFLAGSASILTLKYNSKDIDSIRSGCKLAFRYKARDYWLNVMSFEKKGYEVELTAYSLGLELNNETRGEHKPANAMSIAEYVAYYDPEHALTIGVNEVSDKLIKLEWTGTDTILARLFSVANSFDAELDFNVELNDDYSLKRQVLNIYRKGNLGTNKVSQPVRVGKELKVINYSDNIKELRTAVRATGKDGLTIDGLNKKIYDDNKELLYYSSGMTVYAPQSRDRFPSVGKSSNDNWIVKDLGETQYETKEALWGYMYGEIQKISVPEITYEVEGAIDAGIGDTQTLIDDKHFEPALYVQARVSELEDDILTGKVTKSTFINFERQYSQIADELQKRVNELVEASIPYTIKVSSDNGTVFKNATGTSTFKARVFKGEKEITSDVTWRWSLDGNVTNSMIYTIKGADVTEQSVLTVAAYIGNDEVETTEIDVINVNDGADGKTSYHHWAYSDEADGTGLTLTDNGQRYMGYYTDHTQADSTDKTKYRWADRWAKIEVGGSNLFKGSRDFSSSWRNADNGVFFEEYKGVHIHRTQTAWSGKSQFFNVKAGEIYTFSFYAKSDYVNDEIFFFLLYDYISPRAQGNPNYKSIRISTDYQRYSITFEITSDGIIFPRLERGNTEHFLFFGGFKLETGTVPTDWSPAPEDIQDDIDSKADQTLTQEQLNALEAKRLQMEVELKAKATLEEVSELEKIINNLKQDDTDGRQKIIETTKTIEERVKDIAPIMEYSQKLQFMDTYITQGNGGMVIGANDGSTKVVVTPDRISFQSGGSEVAYISQSMLHIDNGVFTMSLQLGHYITRAHPKNEYVNATYFVK